MCVCAAASIEVMLLNLLQGFFDFDLLTAGLRLFKYK